MKQKKRAFKKSIKIRESKFEKIKELSEKMSYSYAGTLDLIINNYLNIQKKMYPCKKCLENTWDIRPHHETKDGIKYKWIEAVCNICGSTVEFGFKEKKIVENENDPCRHCGTPVILKIVKNPKSYSHYLFCPNCKERYMSEKYKIK